MSVVEATSSRSSVCVRAGEGPKFWLVGDRVTPKVGPEQTGGLFAVAELDVSPHSGPPPHRHSREDEAFYVLDGRIDFVVDDTLYHAKAGDFFFARRNQVHTFHNPLDVPSRMLLYVSPTYFLQFSAECATPDHGAVVPVTPEIIERVMRLAPQYGLEILPGHQTRFEKTLGESDQIYWVLGDKVTILCQGCDSTKSLAVVRVESEPGNGPPPHIHENQDELFYVLDGQLDILIGQETVRVAPGDVAFVPRGTRHTYINAGRPAKFISYHTPSGMEEFFAECGRPVKSGEPAPKFPPPAPEQMVALLGKHGMRIA